jgi:hypothetical protein
LALLGLLAVLVAVGWGWTQMRARGEVPTGSAQWIWAVQPARHASPGAFCLVRDFTLDAQPSSARLLITAEEEYRLFLNGRPVGSRRRSPTDFGDGRGSLDRYDIGSRLLAGGNRLMVELRHSRGRGGLLLSLLDGEGRELVVSDGGWSTLRAQHRGLLEGWSLAPQALEPVEVWGHPPVGRWDRPARIEDGLPAAPPEAWTMQEPPISAIPSEGRLRWAFAWPRRVCGFLELHFAPQEGETLGVLYLGEGSQEPAEFTTPIPVLRVPEAPTWWSAEPYCFQQAHLYGLEATARLLPVPESAAVAIPGPPAGVLGLTPPRRRDPVLFAVGRRLRGTPAGLELETRTDLIRPDTG